MTITYNGNIHTIDESCTIHQFLESNGNADIPMMVKLNGTLIPGKDMKDFQLKERDVLSVIIFMGGG